MLLLLVFWRTDKSRVPLYLTNRDTATALLKTLPALPSRIIDLGCGDGGLLRRLALARPDCTFVGIEHAPLTWLVAQLRVLGLSNASVRRGDFWREPLGDYALAYAFLSPAPMLRLWAKACAEMRSDARLVSNSFAVPDVTPKAVVAVGDRRATRLYVYQPACPADKGRDSAAFPAIPPTSDQE
jgi:SAM-dependent methyltransferase